MSKIAQYINEHILGDVTTNLSVRRHLAQDASIMAARPEVVVYPRITGDIRKVVRFADQMAERGHVLTITPRGAGTDGTGGAIGKGISLIMPAHMDHLLEFDARQQLVRVQPGLSIRTLNEALQLQGSYLPVGIQSAARATVGGAVASGHLASYDKQGELTEYVQDLEVILANGDAIQTRRLTKREFSKKIAQTDFEGEIYRAVDALIEENQALVDSIDTTVPDASGYASIARVRGKDGSFDLTPLFVGSQGTLGIISEMIMRVEYYNDCQTMVAMAFSSQQHVRDMIDEIQALGAARATLLDGQMIAAAQANGYRFDMLERAKGSGRRIAGVLLCTFDEFSERARRRKAKKCQKIAEKLGAVCTDQISSEGDMTALQAIERLPYGALKTHESDIAYPALFTDIYIPARRLEEFMVLLHKFEKAQGVSMPFRGDVLQNIYDFYPAYSYGSAQKRQAILKAFDMFEKIVQQCGGSVAALQAEGRAKSPFVRRQWTPELAALYDKIRAIFDPRGILNTGVKQTLEPKDLITSLRTETSDPLNIHYAE